MKEDTTQRQGGEQQQQQQHAPTNTPTNHIHLQENEKEFLQKQLQEFQSTASWSQLIQEYKHQRGRGITILDALAASGLRSIRYWTEIPYVQSITINDLDPAAIDLAKENITMNLLSHVLLPSRSTEPTSVTVVAAVAPPVAATEEALRESTTIPQNTSTPIHESSSTSTINTLPPSSAGIRLQVGDATQEMYLSRRLPHIHEKHNSIPTTPWEQKQRNPYHVIDLDPYGSAAMFLDAAVQAVVDGGLLAITCTDMRALGGSSPETCFKRYSSMPLSRSSYLQEMALRILLYSVATTAAKYGRIIKPILSVGMHFYIRVFVEIWDDKAAVH